jgi:outer membrane protein TolC
MSCSDSRASRAIRRRAAQRGALLLGAVHVLLAAGAALAQDPLTLPDALRNAQQRSGQLAAQQHAADAARAMAGAARELPDPQLRAGITNLPIEGEERWSLTRDFMTMRSIGLMQEFTRGAKRAARAARFEREADAAEAGRLLALADVQREAGMAWFDRHYGERMREVLIALREETRLQVQAADAAYRAARGAQADVFAARAAVAQIEDRIDANERSLAAAQARLARWVGAAAQRPLAPAPDITRLAVDAAEVEAQLAAHPQIRLIAQQEAVARAEADIAQSEKKADWAVELMYSQRGPAFSNMVSINVSVPLQWDQKNRQEREVAARLSMAERMRAEREDMERERAAEVRGWIVVWQGNVERLRRYDTTLLPLATERTRAALAAYRGGGTLAAALEARRMEIDTRMEHLRLQMETAAVWTQLATAIPADALVATAAPKESPR